MALKTFRPLTPSQRFKALPSFEEITKSKPEKSLLETKNRTGGRNNNGRKTSRHRGGGHKRKYRIIDFKRVRRDAVADVIAIEYDPNRSARLALIQYADGEKAYIIAASGLSVGSKVSAGEKSEPNVGNALPLKFIPLGLAIHNVELVPGKAGRSRWLGIRPQTRGMAMNPVDHPMGGGQGKSKGGGGRHHPMSPWGQLSKGFKTRQKHKQSDRFIVARRKKK